MTENATPAKPRSALAIVALVLGILALITSFLPIINNGSFILALVGAVLAIIAVVSIKRGKTSGMAMAVVSLVICVLSCAIVLYAQASLSSAINDSIDRSSGAATEQILGTEVDVEIGAFKVDDSSSYLDGELPVTVTNLADEAHSYSIKIEAVNADGDRLEDDTVYASELGAGQKQQLEAFTLASSDTVKKLKDATFNIVSISQY